jgi:transposase InsO family protein
VVVQHYHSDNGSAFTSKAYSDHLGEFAQITTYAGVGAHHHNGKAERSIQTIMSMARTMMLHAAIHWPDMVDDVSMWHMAVQYAVHIYNHIPNPSSGLSPANVFTRLRIPLSKLHNLNVWGFPAMPWKRQSKMKKTPTLASKV